MISHLPVLCLQRKGIQQFNSANEILLNNFINAENNIILNTEPKKFLYIYVHVPTF